MFMKLLVIVLMVVGITFVINGYLKQNMDCGTPKIVYKYIPRSFAEEQDNPVKPSDLFSKMFTEASILTE